MLKRFFPLFLLFLLISQPAARAAQTPAQGPGQTSGQTSSQTSSAQAPAAKPSSVPGYSMADIAKLTESVTRTGVGFNSIPALHRPQFLGVSDASLSMDDNEVVFIVTYPNGLVRIYPQRILVWHEVINDVPPDPSVGRAVVPGKPEADGDYFSISYSPVSGSVVAFRSMAGRYPSAFGVVGELLNGNSLLFDWATQSTWSQLLGVAIDGPLRGRRLDRIPVVWATWRGAKRRYLGKAEVLSRSTGHTRPYGQDPYGSYQVRGTYYDDTRVLYPVTWLDNRLPPKKRILGIEHDSIYGALQVDAVKEQKLVNFTLGVTPMVGLYDEELEAVRIFDRRLEGQDGNAVTLALFEGRFTDQETRSEWNYNGECVYGKLRGQRLSPVYAIDAMWFAWAAFHRGSEVFPPLPQKW